VTRSGQDRPLGAEEPRARVKREVFLIPRRGRGGVIDPGTRWLCVREETPLCSDLDEFQIRVLFPSRTAGRRINGRVWRIDPADTPRLTRLVSLSDTSIDYQPRYFVIFHDARRASSSEDPRDPRRQGKIDALIDAI